MGAGGVPNRSVKIVYGRPGSLIIRDAVPNSRTDLYYAGKRIQSRWYDFNGDVIRNRDYFHQDAHNNHEFPHDHTWTWKDGRAFRSKEYYEPDYKNFN